MTRSAPTAPEWNSSVTPYENRDDQRIWVARIAQLSSLAENFMPLCIKCRRDEATIHFTRTVDGVEKVNVHLCAACARPTMARLEASRQGRQKCEFCGGVAFNPLPAVVKIIYACCGCRAEYARIFFDLCATERPDLLERSKRDICFFDMAFDPEVEDWLTATSNEAVEKLRTLDDGRNLS